MEQNLKEKQKLKKSKNKSKNKANENDKIKLNNNKKNKSKVKEKNNIKNIKEEIINTDVNNKNKDPNLRKSAPKMNNFGTQKIINHLI